MKRSFSPVMNLTSDMKYAAMYARVSTEDQGKGFSIPTQIEACQELAAREGYTVPQAYVLIDEGISRDHNGSAKSAEAPRPGEYPSHYGRHCV
jgi:DNA invertase Pin-like site-specific DNA recombinase